MPPRSPSRVIVVTGASDGIGAAAAQTLNSLGHRVIVVGRSPEKTRAVAEGIGASFYLADYTKFTDVRALARRLLGDLPRIDVLANNAGGIMGARTLTQDGHEMTIQVNHLSPYLLTNLLMDRLVDSRARVITTSSVAHRPAATLDLDDLTLSRRYRRGRAYSTAKLLNILFTRELHRRFGAAGAPVGRVPSGGRQHELLLRSSVACSTSATRSSHAAFFAPRRVAPTPWRGSRRPTSGPTASTSRTVGCQSRRPQSRDPHLARELWDRSALLTGLA